MSSNTLVMPFDAQMREYALQCSIPAEGIVATGRRPTLDELKEAATSIPAHSCSVCHSGDKFDIRIESEAMRTFPCEGNFRNTVAPGLCIGPESETVINGATDSMGVIQWMSFHGNTWLEVEIVRKLTSSCGPQALIYECDGLPWIINSSDAVPIGLESWQGELPEKRADE